MIENKVSDTWSNIRRGAAGLALGAGLAMFGAGAFAGAYPYHDHDSFAQEQQKVEQADPKTTAYANAMSAQSIDEKIRLLEQYITAYNESQYHKYAFKELAIGYYGKKDYDKVILNGDKALGFTDLDAESRVQMFLITGESYVVSPSKKNFDKASDYASRAEQTVKSGGVNQGYLKGVDALRSLVEKARSGVSAPAAKPDPLNSAKSFYNKKDYVNAEKAFASLDQSNADVNYYYGLSLYQNKKFNESIEKLVAASLIAPEKFPKVRDTAYSIFINNVYKEPKSNRPLNSIFDELTSFLNSDIARWQKEWDGKYLGKELTEDEHMRADREEKEMNAKIQKANDDIKKLKDGYKKVADDAFNQRVEEIRKRLGIR
ncbi:hypothetical protein JXB28_02195 [Candidatus Woesearchaeota archaeon]|nr:hypothetical protein [Candidatus Woesearchaeota archaeon]